MTLSATLESQPVSHPRSIRRVPFEQIERGSWDRLLAATPAATPFSRWTFHRAWWDAYGGDAEDHYLVVDCGAAHDQVPMAIVPLMLRMDSSEGGSVPSHTGHRVDVASRSRTTLFMAATHHADYATALVAPADLPGVTDALAGYLAADGAGGGAWDCIDLRRLRGADPLLAQLLRALRRHAGTAGWTVTLEAEDVCPVVSLAGDWEAQLAGMGKKARHEVRRKLRRAERHGAVGLRYLPLSADSVERFMRIHQARWGTAGLFPDHAAGERSRTFLHRLVALERDEGDQAQLHLAEVTIGARAVYVLAGFADEGTTYFYNAGMEPAACDLSPGVVGTAVYIRDRLVSGDRRFDFLRGNEAYKYEWGAEDEAIHRLLVQRDGAT